MSSEYSEHRHEKEVDRIKAEYIRREKEISASYYSMENPGYAFMYNSLKREVSKLFNDSKRFSLVDSKVLEIGYGKGEWLTTLKEMSVSENNLAGIELDEKRSGFAKKLFPKADLKIGDASKLPWADGLFDMVVQATVFTSVLDWKVKQKIAKEMTRVLKPNGIILWYDFYVDNPKNPNVKGVKKSEIEQLFPGFKKKYSKITLAPPITRALAPYSLSLCGALEKLKFLNTHYLAVLYKHE